MASIVLENVRVSFVNVVEPAENPSGNLAYNCCVLVDKGDKGNLARVADILEKTKKAGISKSWGGKLPKFKNQPFRDGDAELESGDREGSEYKNCMFFNPSMLASKGKPGVVDENLAPVMSKDKIYSGCYCNVQVSAYPYNHPVGGKGIGWGLQNVMFVEDGDRLDGRESAENAFASLAPQTAGETNEAGGDDNF